MTKAPPRASNSERLEIEREGEENVWVQFRPKKQRFTGGERRAIYKFLDEVRESGAGGLYMQYELLRRISLHLIHSWSVDGLPCPRVTIVKGAVTGYENEESMDALDDDVEKWILAYANEWAEKLALNFAPDPDLASPTKPSDDSKPVSEDSAA